MNTIVIILCLVLFLFVVVFVNMIVRLKTKPPDGLLNVDQRDPEKDYYDFVFLIPTGEIPKKKFLKIEVFVKSENSQGENF